MQFYPAEIETQMQRYYQSLSEKDRRRYAAIEAVKLGYGGKAYIRRLLGCHHETVQVGMRELQDETALGEERIRQPGGGRKSAFETIAGLDDAFLRVLVQHTAGSPVDETLKWTNLNRHQIAELLKQEGIDSGTTRPNHYYRLLRRPLLGLSGSGAPRPHQESDLPHRVS